MGIGQKQSQKIPEKIAKLMYGAETFEKFFMVKLEEDGEIQIKGCGVILNHPKYGINYVCKEGSKLGEFKDYTITLISYNELCEKFEDCAMKKLLQ